jgi:copper chaperone CopZ
MAVTHRFRVEGMTCGGCERSLGRAVSRLAGVERVDASHAEHSATVTYDDAVITPEAIAAAIREAGYQPTSEGGT